jgi:hypothetical protein
VSLILLGGFVDDRIFISDIEGYGLGYISNFTSFTPTTLFRIPNQYVITAREIISEYPNWIHLQSDDSIIGLYIALTKFHPDLLRKGSKKYALVKRG